MKYIIILVLLGLGVLGGNYYLNDGGKVDVINNAPFVQTKEVTKEVNPLEEKYVQREKELDEKYSKIQSIEARIDVNQAEVERLTGEIKKDRAELSGFMTATESNR